jgi:hypothetical protein
MATTRFQLVPTIDKVLQADVVSLINQLWSMSQSKRHVPCPNPSNLERKDFCTLSSQKYLVSPKVDGIRMFLLMGAMADSGKTYSVLINRAYDMFSVKLIAQHQELYDGTLLDGELCQQANGDYHYTVFDAVVVEGYDLKSYPFDQRQDAYQGAVGALSSVATGFTILSKQWFPLDSASRVYEENKSNSDGLILQPVKGKLKSGIQADVFKWKPLDKQTIDFYISVSPGQSQPILECGHGADFIQASEVHCQFDNLATCSVVFGSQRQVYECCYTRFNPDNQKLCFAVVKPRPDKRYANDARVVISTLRSIQENITVEEIETL